MDSTLQPIASFIQGKRIALIGNAQSLLLHSNREIDDFDIVIRINAGPFVAQSNPNIGKRTDILLISGFLDSVDDLLQMATHVIYMTPLKRDLLTDKQREALFFYPTEWWHELNSQVGERPSTGCMGIDMVNRFIGNGELHLYGFDFWRTPTSYNGSNRPGPHSPGAEEAFALKHVPAERIHSFRQQNKASMPNPEKKMTNMTHSTKRGVAMQVRIKNYFKNLLRTVFEKR